MGGAPRRPFLQVYILKSTLYSDFYAVNVLLGHLLLARAASGGRVSQVLEMCAGDLQRWAQDHGVNELSLPRKIFQVSAIPVLGTGKMDIGAVQKLAAEIAAQNEASGTKAAE